MTDTEIFKEISNRLDDIELRQRDHDGIPGTTEKIAMELADMNKILERIASSIEKIADKFTENC